MASNGHKPIKHLRDLLPDKANARKHSSRNVGLIETALGEVGAGRSIVIDENGAVLAGNATIEAAARAGIERVQVVKSDGKSIIAVQRDGLTAKQKKRLALLDNAPNAPEANPEYWDDVVIADIARQERALLDGIFRDDELNKILAGQGGDADAEPQIDRAEELNKKWKVAAGDLFAIGSHRLLCGDSTRREDVDRVMGGDKAGACVTDPPYGQNQIDVPGDEPENNLDLLTGCVNNMPIENGIVIAFQSPRMFPNWMRAISDHKFLRALWLYKEAQMANPWRGWILKSEMILVSEVGKGEWLDVHPYAHDCYKLSEVSFRTEKIAAVRPHGSVKPLSVVTDLVSRVGGDVYEPFAGSGTTLVACQNLSRRCRAIEISPAYCAVILERMATAFPDLVIERVDNAKQKQNGKGRK